jgi:hypothetical protein
MKLNTIFLPTKARPTNHEQHFITQSFQTIVRSPFDEGVVSLFITLPVPFTVHTWLGKRFPTASPTTSDRRSWCVVRRRPRCRRCCWMLTLHLMSFPTHRSSSLSSLLLDANTTLCLLRRSRVIVRPRYRRCDWMLPYYLCTSSFPEASFVVVLVVVAVVWMLPSSLCTSSFPRRGSSSSSLSPLLLEVTLLCVLHCADRSHTLPRGISPLWDHESPIICRGNVERSYTATVISAC